MKITNRIVMGVLSAVVLAIILPAQERGGRETAGSSSSGESTASRGVSADTSYSSVSTSVSTSVSRDYSSGAGDYHSAASGGGSPSSTPDLTGTSFCSADSYYHSMDFFYWVHRNYYLDRYYFSRFYRNTEPLITPQLAKLTLRQPLALSSRMLAAIDELEMLIRDAQAGKQVSKESIAYKTNEIRELAKQLRQDESLNFFDQRKDRDLLRGTNYQTLGLEAVAQLREMALDMNNQIKRMYEQSSTSTISVDSLAQPSFTSLSKGIERLSRVISNSARRLS